MTIFLSKSVKHTLEVFLGYSYDFAYFHPDILKEAILIKKACRFRTNNTFSGSHKGILPKWSKANSHLHLWQLTIWLPRSTRHQRLKWLAPHRILLSIENWRTKKFHENSRTVDEEIGFLCFHRWSWWWGRSTLYCHF